MNYHSPTRGAPPHPRKGALRPQDLGDGIFQAYPDPPPASDAYTSRHYPVLMVAQGAVRHIRINNSYRHNALSDDLQLGLYGTLQKYGRDVPGKAVLVDAVGKEYCTGTDVKSLYAGVLGLEGVDKVSPRDYFRHQYKLMHLVSRFRKPMIPFVDGKCMGAGVGLVANAAVSMGTEKATFSVPNVRTGLPVDGGNSYILGNLPYNLGKLIALTGMTLSSTDMYTLDLLSHRVTSDTAHHVVENLENQWSSQWERILYCLAEHHDMDSVLHLTTGDIEAAERCFRAKNVSDILEALDNDPHPVTKRWASALRASSPLALQISLELLDRAEELNRVQAFKMEYRAVRNMVEKHPDFLEGVRSTVLERKRPRWESTVEGVSASSVEGYLREYEDPSEELSLRDPFADHRELPYVPFDLIRRVAHDAIDQFDALGTARDEDFLGDNRQEAVAGGVVEGNGEARDEPGTAGAVASDGAWSGSKQKNVGLPEPMTVTDVSDPNRAMILAVAGENRPPTKLTARLEPYAEYTFLAPEDGEADEERDHMARILEQKLLKESSDQYGVLPALPEVLQDKNLHEQAKLQAEEAALTTARLIDSLYDAEGYADMVDEAMERIIRSEFPAEADVLWEALKANLDGSDTTEARQLAEFEKRGTPALQAVDAARRESRTDISPETLKEGREEMQRLMKIAEDPDQRFRYLPMEQQPRELSTEDLQVALDELAEQIEEELHEIIPAEVLVSMGEVGSEKLSVPRDQVFEAEFVRVIKDSSAPRETKYFYARIDQVFRTRLRQLQHCDGVPLDERRRLVQALQDSRNDWCEVYKNVSTEEQAPRDPTLEGFRAKLAAEGVPQKQAARLILSERTRQWVDVLALTQGLSPVAVDLMAARLEAFRTFLLFRHLKLDHLEQGLLNVVDGLKDSGGHFLHLRDMEDEDLLRLAREQFLKHLPIDRYANHVTNKEFARLLSSFMSRELSDVGDHDRFIITKLIGYTYKAFAWAFRDPMEAVKEFTMERYLEVEQRKREMARSQRLYKLYGGGRFLPNPPAQKESIAATALEPDWEFGTDPYLGLDLRGLGHDFERRF